MTINVSASHTVDFTVTVIESESETATDTLTETVIVTEVPAPPPRVKRHASSVDKYGYDVPDYASMCTDIYQYSSARDCIGFVPSTSTAPAPETTRTITATVTQPTAIVTDTIATLSFTRNVTTIPVTATVTTVSVSQAVGTVTQTTIVTTKTITVTNTASSIETPTLPAPRPTVTGQIFGGGAAFVEDITIPPGAQVGVIATYRDTALPATFVLTPDGDVTLLQSPAPTVPYKLYTYAANRAFSYVQITTKTVANILSMTEMNCDVGPDDALVCYRNGRAYDFWVCERNLAAVWGDLDSFTRSCGIGARKVDLQFPTL